MVALPLRITLLAMLAWLPIQAARADDATPAAERSVDLASRFLNLSFEGIITTSDSGDNCTYKIPSLAIRFAMQEGLATTAIELDAFRVAAFSAEPSKQKLLEQRHPLTASLSSSESETHFQNIEFTIPKVILRQAEYIALAVAGRPVFSFDGSLTRISPEDKARLLQSHALWPISARPNIASQTSSPDGERGQTIYRTPADPNDDCSSVKIR